MPPLTPRPTGRAYWRSLDDLADSPEFQRFVRNEFPALAEEMLEPSSRRSFLKLMGASAALAGMTACRRWPREEVAPYAHGPEGLVPGEVLHFATSMEIAGVARGLLVASYDGRPIKVEGNPLHPQSLGGTDILAVASLLDLYDPDRSRSVLRREGRQTATRRWEDFQAYAVPLFRSLRARGGDGLRIVSETSSSPTLLDTKSRVLDVFPRAIWHEWEPVSRDQEVAGSVLAFGGPFRPQYHLERASVIVCFDADLLMTHPNGVRHAREFAKGRRADAGTMNRLYAIEAVHSLTGAAADHRLPVPPSQIPRIVVRLAAELFRRRGLPLPAGADTIAGAIAAFDEGADAAAHAAAARLADDLLRSKGTGLVAAGPRQPAEIHALVHVINAALDNTGRTVTYTIESHPSPSHLDSIRALAQDMAAGRVDTLLLLGGNPAFDAPSDLEFGKGLSRVPNSIRLGDRVDETSLECSWHLPKAHYLEAWGDTRAWDGTIGITQPLIEPIFDGKSPIELLALVMEDPLPRGLEIVRRTLQGILGAADFERRWNQALHDGIVRESAWPEEHPKFDARVFGARLTAVIDGAGAKTANETEVVFAGDISVHDGRFANNGWLMEMPDPLTKLSWDNAALIPPSMADAMQLVNGDILRLTVSGRSLEIPAFVLPGQADGSITLPLGYGRRAGGHVAEGAGFNVYPLRTTSGPDLAVGRLERAGGHHPLATTQDHHVIDDLGKGERARRAATLIREAELAYFLREPDFAKHAVHHPPLESLWKEHEYNGHRWGMAIDLAACIGCNACVIACQAENNIPIVGKEEVRRGREMHWIRVDRYFSGEPRDPAVAFQPVACQHCENAPCEQVCPVAATVHDHEGLNVMVYNRCVGTRYCSNNCPYKVRRFNWFNNHKGESSLEMMVYNPEVSVRARGVMEKCTFCVQRISAAKIAAKNEQRPVRDGEVVTACQQACPTQAITFGDLNDASSRVRALHGQARSYGILEEINVKPRIHYQAKLRNRGEVPPAEGGHGHEGQG